jgi:hypothetical protein
VLVSQPSPARVALSCASLVNIAGRLAASVDEDEIVVAPDGRFACQRLVATCSF